MEKQEKNKFRTSSFFKWFINNKLVTVLLVLLLIFLNILLVSKISFVFEPIGAFIGIIFLPVILAAVFYYLLNPIVDFLEKRKLPRIVSITLLFILTIGLIVWGLAVAIPSLVESAENFSSNAPSYVKHTQKTLNDVWASSQFDQFKPQLESFTKNLGNNLIKWADGFSTIVLGSLTSIISKTASVLISLVVFPFVLFYLLKDGKNLNGYITKLLPPAWRKDSSKIMTDMNNQLSSYVRGQVIVAFAVSIMLAIGLSLIGFKYAISIAILSGFLNLIPFLGFYLAIIPACIIGLAIGGPFMLVKVIIVYSVEQLLEGRLVSPLVLGKQLAIHPITVLFLLLTGADLWGVWGALLVIPIYAALKVVVMHIYEWYRQISDLYQDEQNEDESDDIIENETEELEGK